VTPPPAGRAVPDSGGAGADSGGIAARALAEELTAGGVGGPGVAGHEARFIVDEVLGVGPGGGRPEVVPPPAVAAARAMAARRAAGEPLQYIFGHWPFRELDLRVDARVLIPRPETEQVVEVALGEARRLADIRPGAGPGAGSGAGLVAVDAGTGSGAVALALATALGAPVAAEVWATDLSADALAVAAANVRACGPSAVPGLPAITLAEGSWLSPLPPRLRGYVDLVVSNPPYVTEEEWAGLDPEVRAEPRQALVAGPGRSGTPGLADVEAVLAEALTWLARPGVVVVELAPSQAGAAKDRARQLGYDEVRVEPDLAGRPRALVARRGGLQQGQ
jgi:release factor glutamine methyltransferase